MAYNQWYNSAGYQTEEAADAAFLGKEKKDFENSHACYGSLTRRAKFTVTRGIWHNAGIELEAIRQFVLELQHYFPFAQLRIDAGDNKKHLYSKINYEVLDNLTKTQVWPLRLVYHTFLRTPQETPQVFSAAWNLYQAGCKAGSTQPFLYYIWVCYASMTLRDRWATKDIHWEGPHTYSQGTGHGWCNSTADKVPASIEAYLATVLYGSNYHRQITTMFANSADSIPQFFLDLKKESN